MKTLISATEAVAMGNYRDVDKLFNLTNSQQYPIDISRLAEAFGMMVVQLEARQHRLENLIDELKATNLQLEETNNQLYSANIGMLETLGNAIAKRDSDTSDHNYRVTLYSIRLAEGLSVDHTSMKGLIKGAFLHDIGKIAISDSILLKPGGLTEEEYTIMKTHVSHGADIVEGYLWLKDCLEVVLYHHERYDGSGYLKSLKGEEIPKNARIFSVADVFDALTSKRPYKEPFSLEKSTDILLKDRDKHFDPLILDVFIDMAPQLYSDFAKSPLKDLKSTLNTFMDRYFHS